ncbi:MAG TPA: GtrA family protein [Rubrivivax sp.]|nr:GtrA family protein [Rubrivivax sp.]
MSPPRFIRYLAAGIIAAAVNLAARAVLSLWLPFEVAVVLAYAAGMATAFLLMRRFAFGPGARGLASQMSGFVAVNALAVLQTLVVSSLLLRFGLPALGVTHHAELIAHAIGVAVPVVTSYFGHQKWSFR